MPDYWQLEENTDRWQLEENTDLWLLEESAEEYPILVMQPMRPVGYKPQ